jgi:hypothetical protein
LRALEKTTNGEAGEPIHTYDGGKDYCRGWGKSPPPVVVRDGKDFHGRAARKAAGIFREEGRADLHAAS